MTDKCLRNEHKLDSGEKVFIQDINNRINNGTKVSDLKYKKLQEYADRF